MGEDVLRAYEVAQLDQKDRELADWWKQYTQQAAKPVEPEPPKPAPAKPAPGFFGTVGEGIGVLTGGVSDFFKSPSPAPPAGPARPAAAPPAKQEAPGATPARPGFTSSKYQQQAAPPDPPGLMSRAATGAYNYFVGKSGQTDAAGQPVKPGQEHNVFSKTAEGFMTPGPWAAAGTAVATSANQIVDALATIFLPTAPHTTRQTPSGLERTAVKTTGFAHEIAAGMGTKMRAGAQLVQGLFGLGLAPGVLTAEAFREGNPELAEIEVLDGGFSAFIRDSMGSRQEGQTFADMNKPMKLGEIVELAVTLKVLHKAQGAVLGGKKKPAAAVPPEAVAVPAALAKAAAVTAPGVPGATTGPFGAPLPRSAEGIPNLAPQRGISEAQKRAGVPASTNLNLYPEAGANVRAPETPVAVAPEAPRATRPFEESPTLLEGRPAGEAAPPAQGGGLVDTQGNPVQAPPELPRTREELRTMNRTGLGEPPRGAQELGAVEAQPAPTGAEPLRTQAEVVGQRAGEVAPFLKDEATQLQDLYRQAETDIEAGFRHGVKGDVPLDEALAQHVTREAEAGDRLRSAWEIVREHVSNDRGSFSFDPQAPIWRDVTPEQVAQFLADALYIGAGQVWRGAKTLPKWQDAMVEYFGGDPTIRQSLNKAEFDKAKAFAKREFDTVLKQSGQPMPGPGADAAIRAAGAKVRSEIGPFYSPEMLKKFEQVYDGPNAELVLELQSPTSTMRDPESNMRVARRIWADHLNGTAEAKLSEVPNPYGIVQPTELRAVLRREPNRAETMGPKHGNYVENLKGNLDPYTVDTVDLLAQGYYKYDAAGKKVPLDPGTAGRRKFIEAKTRILSRETGDPMATLQEDRWRGMKAMGERGGSSESPGDLLIRQVAGDIISGTTPRELIEAVKQGRELDLGEFGIHGEYTLTALRTAEILTGRAAQQYMAGRLPVLAEAYVRKHPDKALRTSLPQDISGASISTPRLVKIAIDAALSPQGDMFMSPDPYVRASEALRAAGIPAGMTEGLAQNILTSAKTTARQSALLERAAKAAARVFTNERGAVDLGAFTGGESSKYVETLETFRSLITGGDFTALSAERGHLTPAENAARTGRLEADLRAAGYDPIHTRGQYGGAPEASFIVPGLLEAEAMKLAKKYEQESILTKRGLVYTEDGSVNPGNVKATDFSGTQTDYYTSLKIGDQEMKFTVPIDFETKIPGSMAQAHAPSFAERILDALGDERGSKGFDPFQRTRVRRGEYQPNYDQIEADPQVKQLMKNVYRLYRDPIEDARRGVVSFSEQDAAAHRLLSSGEVTVEKILDLQPGDTRNAEWSRAARMIEVAVSEHVTELANKAAAGEPLQPGEIRRALALEGAVSGKVSGIKTESARATGSFGQAVRGEKSSSIAATLHNVGRLPDLMDPTVSDADIAAQIRALGKDRQARAIFSKWALLGHSMIEGMYGSLLSGARTILGTNLGGNVIRQGVDILTTAVNAQVVGRVQRFFGDTQAAVPGEAVAKAVGWWEGAIEQTRMLKHINEFQKQKDTWGGGSRVEHNRTPVITAENYAATMGFDNTQGVGRMVGKGIDAVGTVFARGGPTLMEAGDTWSKGIAGRMQMRALALRKAALEGKTGSDLWARIEEIMQNPEAISPDEVQRYRQDMTFNRDLEGRMGQVQQVLSHPLIQATLFEFFRTPVRLAETAALHTPGLNFTMAQFYRDWNEGGAKRGEAISRLAVGGTIIGAGMWLESQGLATGSEPRDKTLKEAYKQANWKPRSVFNPYTQQYYDISWIPVIGPVMTMAADVSRYSRMGTNSATQLFWAAVISETEAMLSRDFMLTLSHTFELAKNPTPEKSWKWLRDFAAKYDPAFIRQGSELFQPEEHSRAVTRRDDNVLRREFRAVLDDFMKDIPGWGQPPERDPITGKVKIRAGAEPLPVIGPFRTSRPFDESSIHAEVARQGGKFPTVPDVISGRKPDEDDFSFDDESGEDLKGGIRLQPEERDRWVVLMTSLRSGGRTLEQALERTIASPMYLRQKDGEGSGKQAMIYSVATGYKKLAYEKLLREFPELNGLVEAKAAARLNRKLPAGMQYTPPVRP